MSESTNPIMRLFKGHLKLDEAALTELFISHLGNVYCVKKHMKSIFPELSEKASFPELKRTIIESIDAIKTQLLRMDVIYRSLGLEYNEENCNSIKSITPEAYVDVAPRLTGQQSPMLTDMSILTYLRIMESIEITSFDILHDIARSLNNDDVTTMLNQNLLSSLNSRRVFELISKEYIF